MSTRLPKDLERFVQSRVRSGGFTSSDEVITEAVRLLRQWDEGKKPAWSKASVRAWRTYGPGGDGRGRCSEIFSVSSTCPWTHDLEERDANNFPVLTNRQDSVLPMGR